MMYQQGDVILEKAKVLGHYTKCKNYVLAKGEVTGHSHRVLPDGDLIEMIEKDGQLYVKAKTPFKVVHEEHETIEVPEGVWKVKKVREYDHFLEETKNVQD